MPDRPIIEVRVAVCYKQPIDDEGTLTLEYTSPVAQGENAGAVAAELVELLRADVLAGKQRLVHEQGQRGLPLETELVPEKGGVRGNGRQRPS